MGARRPPSAVGLDIGGTKVQGVRGRPGRRAVQGIRHDWVGDPSARDVQRVLRAMVAELGAPRREPVGVAFPGAWSGREGRVHHVPNLSRLQGLSLESLLSPVLPPGTAVENDANAAAWTEHVLHGAPQEDLLAVVLGTGVGGGWVLGGRLQRARWGTAGELGHVRVEGSTRPCRCGGVGCLEAEVGGVRWQEEAARWERRRGSRVAGDPTTAVHRWMAEVNRRPGPPRRWVEDRGRLLGQALASLVNAVGVDRVVLAGGQLRGAPYYLASVQRSFRTGLLPQLQGRVRLGRSRAGPYTVALGAALLAADPAAPGLFRLRGRPG